MSERNLIAQTGDFNRANFANFAGSSLGAATEKRVSRTEETQHELDRQLSLLHEALAVLSDRLQCVMTPPTPTPTGRSPDACTAVPLTVAARIQESAGSARFSVERVQGLIERLEI